MTWNTIVIVICVLLAGFSLYREYQREAKSHLSWRLAAVILAIAALACIILSLSYTGQLPAATANGKVLLTGGFNADSLSAANKNNVYTLDSAVNQQYPNAKLLDNAGLLFSDSTAATPLHILGNGLTADELAQLNDHTVIFHPASIPDGFTAASWTENVKAGQTFRVQGSYKNTSGKGVKLVLKALNTPADSVNIHGDAVTTFNLQTTPKNIGRAVYTLLAINGTGTLQQADLPVTITHTQPLKVLMLSASPDFESKFLKTWLSENGYGVATRSAISKDKFSQEYVNIDQPDLTHLSASLLSKFDVLIGDLSVLKNLNPAESSALQQEVMQKGLGVIIRADSTGKAASWLQSDFPFAYAAGKQPAPAALNVPGKGKTAKLIIDAVYITPGNNTQTLITADGGHILTAASIAGAGKLIFTTANNTHNWMLAGNKDDYRALWSLLIDKAARRLPLVQNWAVSTSAPTVGQPVQLMAEQATPPGGIKINQVMAPAAQNPAMPFQYTLTYWPGAYGWQQVTPTNGAPYWWYVWPKQQWQSVNAAGRSSLTVQYARLHPVAASVTKQIQQKTRRSVPKIYFYILFLMAASFLWAESKFFS